MSNYVKSQEQLSVLFQENCCLKEKLARSNTQITILKKENMELKGSVNHLKKLLAKILETHQNCCGDKLSTDLILQEELNRLDSFVSHSRRFEKTQSSPIYYFQERQPIKSQVNEQTKLSPVPSLNFEVSELNLLQEYEVKIDDLIISVAWMKSQLVRSNYVMKYLKHFLVGAKFSGSSLASFYEETKLPTMLGEGSGDPEKNRNPTSVDSLENAFSKEQQLDNSWTEINTLDISKPSTHADFPSTRTKLTNKSTVSSMRTFPATNRSDRSSSSSSSTSTSNVRKNSIDNSKTQTLLLPFFQRRELSRVNSSSSLLRNAEAEKMSSDNNVASCSFLMARGTDAVKSSSLTASHSLYSSDSLASEVSAPPRREEEEEEEEEGNSSSMLKLEERICPMCNDSFPHTFSQKSFEDHVLSHLELEEFELIT